MFHVTSHPDDPPVFGVADLAARTGLPSRWIEQEAHAGRLPCLNVDRLLLFNLDAVLQELARRAQGTRPPLADHRSPVATHIIDEGEADEQE
jgi:hypothetical protein